MCEKLRNRVRVCGCGDATNNNNTHTAAEEACSKRTMGTYKKSYAEYINNTITKLNLSLLAFTRMALFVPCRIFRIQVVKFDQFIHLFNVRIRYRRIGSHIDVNFVLRCTVTHNPYVSICIEIKNSKRTVVTETRCQSIVRNESEHVVTF